MISVLQDFARKPENLICLLQEPWCNRHGKPPSLPGFNAFTPTPTKPKCVMYVRHTSDLTATTVFTAQDSFLGTMITSHNQRTFTLFNFYSTGWAEPLAAILPSLRMPLDCLLMGDLSAHHLWRQGPLPQTARISSASHAIANWLEDNNFCLQNQPAIPTHHPRSGGHPSTIDLCFSGGSTMQSVLTLAMDHETTADHSTITLSLSLLLASEPATPHQCWHKADWGMFNSRIEAVKMDLSQLQGTDDTLRAITNITRLIHQAVREAVPLWTG